MTKEAITEKLEEQLQLLSELSKKDGLTVGESVQIAETMKIIASFLLDWCLS